MKYLLGIDVGTGGCRCGLFTLDGRMVASADNGYATYRPQVNWAEQEPGDWWEAAVKSIREVISANPDAKGSIIAIGAGGQTNGHVLVDEKGHSLGRAIIWQDRRATEEAEEVKSKLRNIEIAKYLGTRLPIDATTLPPRMLWLQRHEKERVDMAAAMLQPKDFINFRLTGHLATDHASCKTLIDLRTNVFHEDYFAYLGLERRLIPLALPPGAVMGTVNADAAALTGLEEGIPVVAGCIDAWCNILGSGVVAEGLASDVAGSSEVITAFSGKGPQTEKLNVIPSFDGYLLNGPTQSGGDSLKWFSENFPPVGAGEGSDERYEALNNIAAGSPPGSNKLLFAPYLQGERAPIWDSSARGAFIGISKSHTYSDFARAVFEGVAFSVRHITETIREIGGPDVKEIRVSGSGAKSSLWNQIKADATGIKVVVPEVLETGCLGAALLAGMGAGTFVSYSQAGSEAVRKGRQYLPDASSASVYDEMFEAYKQIYPGLRGVFGVISRI